MNDEKKLQYDAIANQIDREDSLINYRLTWTLTLNGFLFATLGFFGSKDSPDPRVAEFFHFALPLTGFFISVAGFFGVLAAFIQIQYLTKQWQALADDRWPRPFGDKKHAYVIGAIPSFLPPLVLILVWIGLFCVWF